MAQEANSFSETLDSSLSENPDSSLSENPDSSLSLGDLSAVDQNQSSSSSDPSLSRSGSISRLNAKAPEFVPRNSSSAPAMSLADLTSTRVVIPSPQASPPGLVHVYPGPNSAFRVPVQGYDVAVPAHFPAQNHHPHAHVPVQYHHHHHPPHHRPQFYGGGFIDHREVAIQAQQQTPVEPDSVSTEKNGISEEATQKIINQVEYYFSDLNLATTEHLMRFINKDAEGYVPISVVASFKKIKALVSSNSQLADILRNSTKLVVSEDGKKVKRQHPLTESDMEELQSRIVVAENLPEDHCHQNLMKIFSAVGGVKNIRTCQPQASNSGASSASRSAKADSMLFSNKLHAFVEYESVEHAEKAVAELTDEANWRSGLRVRLLLRNMTKPVQTRGRKVGHESDVNCEENDISTSEQTQPNGKHLDDPSQHSDSRSHELAGEEILNEKDSQRKGRNRGRGKGRGRAQYHHNNRGAQVGTPPSNNLVNSDQPIIGKQPPGPRMPDGTRGFSMGRGKPVAINIS